MTLVSRTSIAALTLQLRALAPPEAEDSSSSDEAAPPSGSVVVRHWPDHALDIQRWVQVLAQKTGQVLTWRGEGLAEASVMVLRTLLLQRQRQRPTPEQQDEICQRQNGRCAACDGPCWPGEREYDHVVPLRDSAEVQLFQMLCSACHSAKTHLEPRCSKDPLASAFSRAAYEAYVESPRLPALTFATHMAQGQAGEVLEVDVRRCRRNALLHSAHPFPLFCVLDNIVPFPREAPRLFDLQFVDAGPVDLRPPALLRRLPYTGPRWYPRVAAEFMLHHGKVTWADFRWGFDAASHLPAGALIKPLELMEAAWRDVESAEAELPKRSINAALGMLGHPRLTTYRLKTGADIPEARAGGALRLETRYSEGGSCVDWIWETKLLTNASHRPVHDVAVFTEHVRVAQALYVLARLKVPPRNVLCVKTDAVVFQVSAKVAKTVRTQLDSLTFRDLGGLRALYEPPLFAEERRHREQTRPAVVDSDAQVFRVRPGNSSAGQMLPISEPRPFQQPPEPEDVDEDRARALVQEGKSLLILGPPGTGKTCLMKELVSELRAAGRKVVVVAKTHCAVQNASGDHTANHFCHKYVLHGSTSAHCVVVEEISQVDVALWGDLARLQFADKQFLLLGDHEQFGPIGNQWRGTPVPGEALERSSLLRELCPYRLTLSENKRSDPPLFDWYTSLMLGGSRRDLPMEDLLEEARRAFPVTSREARYTLCLSHRKRIAVNGRMNLRARRQHREAIQVKAQPCPFDLNKPQDFWCYPGQQLIGCCRQGTAVRNGCFYVVKEVTVDKVELEEGPVLTHTQAGRSLRLTHALTQAGCQGLTLPGVVRIVETGSARFTRRHLYVCLSRATAFNRVEVL